MEIGFKHVSGKYWRPVLVFAYGEDGEPLDYTYYLDGKQVEIVQRLQRLKMSGRVQIAEARKVEDAEIDDLLYLK